MVTVKHLTVQPRPAKMPEFRHPLQSLSSYFWQAGRNNNRTGVLATTLFSGYFLSRVIRVLSANLEYLYHLYARNVD